MTKQEKSASPLLGYRVLDLTDEKGMFCPRLLADMGAEVIRVDRAGAPSARSPFFVANNLGKRSVTLNLELQAGQEIFKRLVKRADVIVESSGYLRALGLGYNLLSEVNPRLIMASISDFGQNSAYRDYKSCDIVSSALGGHLYLSGEAELPPLKPFGQQSYYTVCLYCAIGVLLALWHHHTSGKGQHIDIAVEECVAATLDHVLARYFYQGVVARRQGSLYWNSGFRIFPCRDGYILLSLFHQWETLVEWLESGGMADDLTDKKYLEEERRFEHLDHVIEVLERWTKSQAVAELVEKGQSMRFPWAEVNSIPKLLLSPQLRERHFFIEVEAPESGRGCRFPGAPGKLSRSPWKVGRHLPTPGEHNMEIYHEELGLSRQEIEILIEEGVI